MELATFRVIVLVSILSVLPPLTVYFLRIKNLPLQNHLIGLLLVVSAVFDALNFNLFTSRQPTYISANLYNIILFAMLAKFFYEVLFRACYRKLFFIGIFIFCVACIVALSIQDIRYEYQSIVWVTEALILCTYCYIYNLFISAGSTHVIFNPHLHSELSIVGGIFIYFSFSIAFFALMNYIMTNLTADASRLLWSIHNGNNVIKNIFFAFGIYYTGKRKITISKQEYDLVVARDSKNVSKNPFLN